MDAPEVGGTRLGLIIGSSLPGHLVDDGTPTSHATVGMRGPVDVGVVERDDVVVLRRHGDGVPAHLVDHHAHVRTLCELGCGRIVALASSGSLRADLPVGSVVAPDDFWAPHVTPTWFDDGRGHQVPGFDRAWRGRLVAAWGDATSSPLVDGGVYAQTAGPRFETPAEVRVLAGHADLVGMTLAAECILAGEIGLPYAGLCAVDNLANGIGGDELTVDDFHAGVEANRDRLAADLLALLPHLTGTTA